MANVVVIGSQWGDEGKGKIVDWLSERAEIVVRYQGGHNAGHTLVIGENVYKLSLLPSGIARPGKLSIIGNGVVIDPWALREEISRLTKQGLEITSENLRIAENAALILPLHGELDAIREDALCSETKIGTTRRGIGPAYEDKVGRRAIRAGDLMSETAIDTRLDALLGHHNPLRKGLGAPAIDREKLKNSLLEIAPSMRPFVDITWRHLDAARQKGQRVLFEGAQGVMLDIDHGTYPYVTSSNTIAGQATGGAGVGPGYIDYVLGITKAYTTRVGAGPFPTEQENDVGRLIGERGNEFGTVTGRPRRCGWFDAVMVRQAAIIGGINGIALTKMDVLDGLDEIKICTGYRLEGEIIDYFPAAHHLQSQVEPVYESYEGWKTSTYGARSWADLPATAIKYVRRVEELIGVPVALLSTSPEREDTILVHDPFSD